tara:strand:+ start:258 stop:746 length:489 start_codon:yes stop_codon:yes gene_type:complete
MLSKLILILVFSPLNAFAVSNCKDMPNIGITRAELNGVDVVISTVEKEIPINDKFVIEILNDEAELEAKRNLILALNPDSNKCNLYDEKSDNSFYDENNLNCNNKYIQGAKNYKVCYKDNNKLILSIILDTNNKGKNSIFKIKDRSIKEENSYSNIEGILKF